jgi:hypothetical protein
MCEKSSCLGVWEPGTPTAPAAPTAPNAGPGAPSPCGAEGVRGACSADWDCCAGSAEGPLG